MPTTITYCAMSNGPAVLTITNLTETAVNYIERGADLDDTSWDVRTSFPTTSAQTNWSDSAGSENKRYFYRVRSR